jgi:tRNA threonylcarbamoyl adenosine modification protein YeaZ
MELAIDTSTDFCSIGLSREGETMAELTWRTQQNHTVELVPNIDRLLTQANTGPRDLEAIFVARGPGSFNGLRVGMSTAKGLAFSLDIPLVGIGTLEVEAYPFAFTGLPVCPIHSAGRGEIATALYRQDNTWRCLTAEHITTVDVLCRQTKRKTVFCGEMPLSVIEELKKKLDKYAIIPEAATRLRQSAYLSALAWQRLIKGDVDDAASLQPLYLRQPPITMRKVTS